MQIRLTRQITFFLAALLAMGLCFFDSSAQQSRKRVSSPNPNTVTAAASSRQQNSAATTSEPKIISTADEGPYGIDQKRAIDPQNAASQGKSRPGAPMSDQELMRRTITALADQVTKLVDKLTQMQEQQQALVDMDRLSRAEQRADTLRSQLGELDAKQTELQMQSEQIDYALRPENIDRALANYGALHPEDARIQRHRELEIQRNGIRAQLDDIASRRIRLHSAIANADSEVEMLRQRLDAPNSGTGETSGSGTSPVSLPSPNESPAPKSPAVPPR